MFREFFYLKTFELMASIEAVTPEQKEKKKEFLLSRLERRWGFNKSKPDRSLTMLRAMESTFKKTTSIVSLRKFNKEKFNTYVEKKQIIPASLMLQGLRQIDNLSSVFEIIVSLPPSTETQNLPKFKAEILGALRSKAPAYRLSGYRVYASFLVDTSLIKRDKSLSEMGYDRTFLEEEMNRAFMAMNNLIKAMKSHEALIHKLGQSIVDSLLGPNHADYLHARRQYELCCTLFTSILTQGPMQYLSMALSLTTSMAQCYDER